jgi:nucleotide-binding universal stress UspA family protein
MKRRPGRVSEEKAMEASTRSAIVVGADGTEASRAAVEFALREAATRGSVVEVLTAWTWDGAHESLAGPVTPHDARGRALRLQDEQVAAALQATQVAPTVSRRVVQGDSAHELVRSGRTAAMLVVGTGHKGALKRAVLGSVSDYCVRHATCPVVVVPTPQAAPLQPPLASVGSRPTALEEAHHVGP